MRYFYWNSPSLKFTAGNKDENNGANISQYTYSNYTYNSTLCLLSLVKSPWECSTSYIQWCSTQTEEQKKTLYHMHFLKRFTVWQLFVFPTKAFSAIHKTNIYIAIHVKGFIHGKKCLWWQSSNKPYEIF